MFRLPRIRTVVVALSIAMEAMSAQAQNTSAPATLGRLSSYQYGDIWREGNDTWAIASKLLDINRYFVDPDNTRSPLHQLYLLRLSAGTITEIPVAQTYLPSSQPAHSAVWSQPSPATTIEFFWNSKTSSGTYGMEGRRALYSKSSGAITSTRVDFSGYNWGWMPWMASDGLHHFSYSGYYEMLNTTQLGGTTPAAFQTRWDSLRYNHSGGILPGTDSQIASRLCNIYCASTAPVARSVIEYYVSGNNKYFITGRVEEQVVLDALPFSFSRTGAAFAATDALFPASGATPICRAYHDPAKGGTNSHFYGRAEDCNAIQAAGLREFTLEGFDFAVGLPSGNSCPAAFSTPIYRLFRPSAPNHRYVTAQTQSATLALNEGWTTEGIAFCVNSAVPASLAPPPPTPPAPKLATFQCDSAVPGAVYVEYFNVGTPAYIFVAPNPAGVAGLGCATGSPVTGSGFISFDCSPEYMFPSAASRSGVVYAWGASDRSALATVIVPQISANLACYACRSAR